MNGQIGVVFTSSNIMISANDNPIGCVQTVEVEDMDVSGEKYTRIVLNRLVSGSENTVNDMRAGSFCFKIFNSTNGNGYIAENAELVGFKMVLPPKKDINPSEFLEQTLTVKAKVFVYVDDARSATFKALEQEDIQNMIKILKANQEKTRLQQSNEKLQTEQKAYRAGAKQSADIGAIKDEELVWLNAADPKKLEGAVKPRKLKKRGK